jgi:hypothetical protein
MTNKELVIEAVRGLPDEASLDDIAEQIAIMAAIRRGEQAAMKAASFRTRSSSGG